MTRFSHITLVLLSITLIGCTCTNPAGQASEEMTADHIMTLNQSGKWKEAAKAAQQYLGADLATSLDEKCQVYHSLIYADIRLGNTAEANSILTQFDQECSELSSNHWIYTEVDKLRIELGLVTVEPLAGTHDDGFWKTADGASMGLDPHILEAHQALCEKTGADACLVVYQGKIVQEWYSPRYHLPIYAMSSTKSVTGILTGMLLDDGKIESIDEPVCTYIPEWCAGDKGKVTLRHLLSMTSGLKNMREDGVGSVSDKNAFVIDLPLTYEPGTKWSYGNEGVQLLSPILDQAAGEPIQDYARRRLFEPLGMLDTHLHLDGEGHAWTHADMETTLRDFARIGLLMLNRGAWEGQQIVSESWVAQSTTASQELAPDYGLLWWLIDDARGFSAQGYLDTDLYIFPERDLVIARMQSAPSDSSEGDYETEAMELIEQLTSE